MSATKVQYDILLGGNAGEQLKRLTQRTERLGETARRTRGLVVGLGKAFVVMNQAADLVQKAAAGMRAYTEANLLQAESEAKLGQVMRTTMGATREQVESIKALARAQQQLGVIGDEVQLGGAQELATYLGKRESLEKLLPVMNDMLAQQYGLNATQEQAVQIASMMGKVMDGQVGALSRYGYKFDEVQEKILKLGTEEQRAATLADVVSSAVGGMNAALAATPEGKIQQMRNTMGDMKERVGALMVQLQSFLMPAMEGLVGLCNGLVAVVEKGWPVWLAASAGAAIAASKLRDRLLETALGTAMAGHGFMGMAVVARQACRSIGTAIMSIPIVGWVAAGVTLVIGVVEQLWSKCEGFRGVVMGVWAVVQNMAGNAWKLVSGVVARVGGVLRSVWSKVTGAVGGLIGRVKGVFDKVGSWFRRVMKPVWDWFGSLWEHVKSIFDKVVGMMGKVFNPIIQLWNKLTKGNVAVYRSGNAKGRAMKGAGEAMPLAPAGSLADAASSGYMDAGGGSTREGIDGVATGGSRSTSVTINIGSLVDQMLFEGSFGEHREEMERSVAEALLRVLNMAQVSVG